MTETEAVREAARAAVREDDTEERSVPEYTDVLSPSYVREHFRRQQEPVDAIPTPLDPWTRQCRDEGGGEGLAPGWHVVVAGATGKGKSLLAENIGAHALVEGESVGFISYEMSGAQLATRLYAIATETPVRRLERGSSFSPASAERAAERLAELTAGARFFVNEHPLRGIHEGLELMRALHEEHGVRLFIVDYLQLAQPHGAESEYQAVSDVSRLVRQFAVERQVVTIGLSQLNRSTSANRADSPLVEGLKSTSSLEQDADQVLLLDHSRYERERADQDLARTWLLLAKNRHGATGEIPILWDYSTLRVREALPDEERRWPGVDR